MVVEADLVVVPASLAAALASSVVVEAERGVAEAEAGGCGGGAGFSRMPLFQRTLLRWTGRCHNAFLEALFQFFSVSRRRITGRRQNAFLEYSLPNAFNGALRSTSWLVRSFRRDIYWLQPLLLSAIRGWRFLVRLHYNIGWRASWIARTTPLLLPCRLHVGRDVQRWILINAAWH